MKNEKKYSKLVEDFSSCVTEIYYTFLLSSLEIKLGLSLVISMGLDFSKNSYLRSQFRHPLYPLVHILQRQKTNY